MDQEQIGLFILQMRKEKGMTQQQLAELLGVTNKAVSRWENGRGMPELSLIPPLCEALDITVNELLSCERLSGEAYLRRAEENILGLVQETEQNDHQKRTFLTILVSMFCVTLGMVVHAFLFLGKEGVSVFFDFHALVVMAVILLLVLLGTNTFRQAGRGFCILWGSRRPSGSEARDAVTVFSMMRTTLLATGCILSLFGYLSAAWTALECLETDQFAVSLALNLGAGTVGILYGMIGFLLLLPLQKKLEVLCNHIGK